MGKKDTTSDRPGPQPRRDSSQTDYEHIIKLVMVGDSGTGKSAILTRFQKDDFSEEYLPTIGVDFAAKVVTLPSSGSRVKIQIWDTAGQERFRSLVTTYLRGAKGVFVVYDVTREETADHVHQWLDIVRTATNEDPPITVLGNKMDLKLTREETDTERDVMRKKFGQEADCFHAVSARTGEGVSEAVLELAEMIVERLEISGHEAGHTDSYMKLAAMPKKSAFCTIL